MGVVSSFSKREAMQQSMILAARLSRTKPHSGEGARPMERLAVGVIGVGAMGTRHARNIHGVVPGARVAGVYDLDAGRAEQVAAECGSAQVFREPLQLIESAGIDAVVIVSPDPTHADFAQACLRHRKPVLCEKPLATRIEDAQAIVAAEQALGRRLIAVGFNRRFDPQHLALQEALASGQLGRPFLFKGVHRNPSVPPNRPGAVVITNSAIHDLDAPRWLLGQEITEVYVRGVRTHAAFSAETQDMLLIQMVLSGDCLATLEVSVAVEYGYEVSAEIVAERGTAMTAQPDLSVIRVGSARSVPVSSDGLGRFQEAYVAELAAWAASLRSGRAFGGASAWDGYVAAIVADACIQSLHSRRPVAVATPARPELYANT
jgi:myo-inositol 2-dehydrogenase/D-chiro-inositol 1-dehydrogenase